MRWKVTASSSSARQELPEKGFAIRLRADTMRNAKRTLSCRPTTVFRERTEGGGINDGAVEPLSQSFIFEVHSMRLLRLPHSCLKNHCSVAVAGAEKARDLGPRFLEHHLGGPRANSRGSRGRSVRFAQACHYCSCVHRCHIPLTSPLSQREIRGRRAFPSRRFHSAFAADCWSGLSEHAGTLEVVSYSFAANATNRHDPATSRRCRVGRESPVTRRRESGVS
jgi:hypothetical protein